MINQPYIHLFTDEMISGQNKQCAEHLPVLMSYVIMQNRKINK